jgi:hypothetical protein
VSPRPSGEAAKFLGRTAKVLQAFADDPATPVHRIDLMDEAERAQLLVQWRITLVLPLFPPGPVRRCPCRRLRLVSPLGP